MLAKLVTDLYLIILQLIFSFLVQYNNSFDNNINTIWKMVNTLRIN